jgi:hypothetical protein
VICSGCGDWQEPAVDREAATLCCAACGHVEPHWFPPLFILTGPAGAGKSAILPLLRAALAEWDVFDTDILWDSAGDWQTVRGNWLRIALSIAQGGRPTLLCGIHVPETTDACPERRYFGRVHYLALTCHPEVREQRLRARPPWRGAGEAFIAEQHAFARWLDRHGSSAFDPPLAVLDTSSASVGDTGREVAAWARHRRSQDWLAGAS